MRVLRREFVWVGGCLSFRCLAHRNRGRVMIVFRLIFARWRTSFFVIRSCHILLRIWRSFILCNLSILRLSFRQSWANARHQVLGLPCCCNLDVSSSKAIIIFIFKQNNRNNLDPLKLHRSYQLRLFITLCLFSLLKSSNSLIIFISLCCPPNIFSWILYKQGFKE